MSQASVRAAHIGEQAVGRADFLFGTTRTSKINVGFPAPDAGAPEDLEPFTPDAVARYGASVFP